MRRKFLDASALVKLYVAEPDSPLVQAQVLPSDTLLISHLTVLEFRSATYGMVRQGLLLLPDANVRIADLLADLSLYEFVPLADAVYTQANLLLDGYAVTHNLRPADAIHVATALEEHRRSPLDSFITMDVAQAAVAGETFFKGVAGCRTA